MKKEYKTSFKKVFNKNKIKPKKSLGQNFLHDKNIYEQFEKHFINAELEKGDFLIFNRRLCHRGGKNIFSKQ